MCDIIQAFIVYSIFAMTDACLKVFSNEVLDWGDSTLPPHSTSVISSKLKVGLKRETL